jgi:POT family proton-dependent oligopeptide transporter
MEDHTNREVPQLLGHPKGLFYLFFAELWERFSFYGMRALLTLFMVEKVFASMADRDISAAAVYASYGSLVYASTVIGGKVADTILGFRKSIIFGGILMSIGQFLLAIPYSTDVFFYFALAFIVVGNGFFKPNISTFVGSLYAQGDPRKDSGFTIFYMGINIGAFIAPLLCGWLAHQYGWSTGFGLAGFGMLIGLFVFQSGIRNNIFLDYGRPPDTGFPDKSIWGLKLKILIPGMAVLSIPFVGWLIGAYRPIQFATDLFGDSNLVNILFQAFGIIVVLYIIYIIVQSSVEERKKLIVAVFLTLFMTIFWGFGELSGSILTLFAERNVHLKWINAAQSNSIWPMFVIVLALPFSILWTWLTRHKLNPRTPLKFAFGMFFIGLAFLILGLSRGDADVNGKVPAFYLLLLYFFITVGELAMSPVGLSKITDLSPKRFMAFMMGVWFLSSTYAFQIVGFIGKKLAVVNESGTSEINTVESLQIYTDGFTLIAKYAFATALIILILTPLLNRWMGKVH